MIPIGIGLFMIALVAVIRLEISNRKQLRKLKELENELHNSYTKRK
jgi:hypothetical protein